MNKRETLKAGRESLSAINRAAENVREKQANLDMFNAQARCIEEASFRGRRGREVVPFYTADAYPSSVLQRRLDNGLRSWRSLAAYLPKASVRALQCALYMEANGKARPQMMRRIITRLATLERNRLYKLLNIKTK
jgi:hypothetical protein